MKQWEEDANLLNEIKQDDSSKELNENVEDTNTNSYTNKELNEISDIIKTMANDKKEDYKNAGLDLTNDGIQMLDIESDTESKNTDTVTEIGFLSPENYGAMRKYIERETVTDINWNGMQLWIDDVKKGRYLAPEKLSEDFVDAFAIRASNVVSRSFNKYQPVLEAETENLRITVVHKSASQTGTAISIRKTPAIKRISFDKDIKNGAYCSEIVANFISNAVKAKMNIIICGLPGVGKTELIKYLTNYIFPKDRVITVEDTLEIHYAKINPGKDCMELKVDNNNFTYTDAIKASLRLLPQWVILSEARSTEVKYLIESVSTGTKCMTTLHTDDVSKIPDRILNMIGSLQEGADTVLSSVYSFFNLGILIDKHIDPDTGNITRFISQIGVFDRAYDPKTNEDVNTCTILVDRQEPTGNPIPENLLRIFKNAGIENPYQYTYIKD